MERIAIIGAGPAGIIAARKAIEFGIEPVIYEKSSDIGGIWSRNSNNAYKNVFMQNSRYAFHFSDMKPAENISDFPSRYEVYRYLKSYVLNKDIFNKIHFNFTVINVNKKGNRWVVTGFDYKNREFNDIVCGVIVAIGEFDNPHLPSDILGCYSHNIEVLTSQQYYASEKFLDKKVLVVGGGVSGADIASDLVGSAKVVDWSISGLKFFLPRKLGRVANDIYYSYIGRVLNNRKTYSLYIEELTRLLPDYMYMYEKSGMLPDYAINNDVHINEKIIPNIYHGHINRRSKIKAFSKDDKVLFADGTTSNYDAIIFCTGYQPPVYEFLKNFDHADLYEHFFYYKDPTFCVLNPPVNTNGVGAAFPYFEIIAHWILTTFQKPSYLPSKEKMKTWCLDNMVNLDQKHFYDSWTESIRLALKSSLIPSPKENFNSFWRIITSAPYPQLFSTVEKIKERKGAENDKGIDLQKLYSLLSYKILGYRAEFKRSEAISDHEEAITQIIETFGINDLQ